MGTSSIIRFLIQWRRFNALWVILAICAIAPAVMGIRFDASVESFLPQGNAERQRYEGFKRLFGEDRMIVVALPQQAVFTPQALARLEALSQRLEALPDVAKATSIATVNIIYGQDQSIDIVPAAQALAEPGRYDTQRIIDKLRSSPLYLRDLVSLDGQVPAILIEARADGSEGKFERILQHLDAQMREGGFSTFYVAGEPVVEQQVTSDMWHDLKTFIPLTSLVLFVLLLALLRNLGDVLVVLAVVTLCTVLLLGGIGLLDYPMNAVTVGLPSIMMCIAVLDCLHLLDTYRQALHQGMAKVAAIEHSMTLNFVPCFLTSFTTAIGFLTLAVSEVAPIRAFGVIAALAAIGAYVLSYLVMPFLLECVPVRQARALGGERYAQWVARLAPVYRSRWLLPVATALVIIVAVLPIGRLHVEASFLNFIDKSEPIRVSTDFVEQHLGGVSSLEISLRAADKGGALEPAALQQIAALQTFVGGLHGVDKSLSIVDFLKDMHREMNSGDSLLAALPDSREAAEQYVFTYSLAGPDNELESFIDYDNQTTRVRIRLQQMPYAELQAVIDQVRDYAQQHSGPFEIGLTSYSVMQSVMVQALLSGMLWGIGFAIVSMLAAFVMLTGSWRISVIAVIVNLMPLVVVFGVMGALGLSINVGTSMIACIIFGLVVDATLHCFYHAKHVPDGATPDQLVHTIFEGIGEALCTGALVLCAGFLVLGLGESYFTRLFGLFCALAILVSLWCNAVGIPYLIHHFYRRGQPLAHTRPVAGT